MQSNRTLVVIILAVVLMVLVMAGAIFISLAGIASREKYEASVLWSVPATSAPSMNVLDLTGDKQRDIFIQDATSIKLLDEKGQLLLEKKLTAPLATTQGDVNGDGVTDLIAYYGGSDGAQVMAFTGRDERIWELQTADLGGPGRATAVDFDNDRHSEVVIGDESGRLLALSAEGQSLWQYTLSVASSLRGLDDVVTAESRLIAAGIEAGQVVVLNRQGTALWTITAPGGLRRLRAFPLGGPQNGHVFVGSISGDLTVYQGTSGQPVWSASLGQAVNQIRPAELDGDPATTEIIVGGKDGGVWAFSQAGQRLWAGNVTEKVNELLGLDMGTGRNAVVAGDDGGTVTIFDADGHSLTSIDVDGPVSRLDSGKLAGDQRLLVADNNRVLAYTLAMSTAPFWYSPILGGLLACGVIAAIAYVVASIKPAPVVQVSAAEMTVEAQRARRRMLHESIQDLQKIQGRGELSGEAYLARLKELRQQLADVNAALIKLGEPIKMETFSCPSCGGPLELGTDRCEYCGQVVIV